MSIFECLLQLHVQSMNLHLFLVVIFHTGFHMSHFAPHKLGLRQSTTFAFWLFSSYVLNLQINFVVEIFSIQRERERERERNRTKNI